MSFRLLVILPHNPGDVVMALQAIHKIKTNWLDVEVDYLTGEECCSLVQGSELIHRAYVIPKKVLRETWNLGNVDKAINQLSDFLNELKKNTYALSINLFQEKWGALVQSVVDAKMKYGLTVNPQGNLQVTSRFLEHLAAIPANRGSNGWHVVDIYIRCIEQGLVALGTQKKMHPTQERIFIEAHSPMDFGFTENFSNKNFAPQSFLAFHPGSAWMGKRWPESHWAELIDRCLETGWRIVLTGSKEESPVAQKILEKLSEKNPSCLLNCVGTTTLMSLATILSQAKLLVTGDTVAMHLAAAQETPVLALFGASNPIETGPYGKGHVVFQTEPELGPNLNFKLPPQGLEKLSAATVAEYLIHGSIPEKSFVWQTDWDAKRKMHIMRDAQNRLASPYVKFSTLGSVLENNFNGIIENHRNPNLEALLNPNLEILAPTQKKVFEILNQCLESPTPAALKQLAEVEEAWANESEHNLIWEAYRIAVNGFPIHPIQHFLGQKRERFMVAIHETEAMNKP